MKKVKGGELSGTTKSGARTSKRHPQHLMSMDMVRTRSRSHWPILFGLNSCPKSTGKDFLVDPTGELRCSILVYKELIVAEAVEALELTSATDGSSTSFLLSTQPIVG